MPDPITSSLPAPYTEGPCEPNGLCATPPNTFNYSVIYGAMSLGALSVTALVAIGVGYYCYKRWHKPVSPTIPPPITSYTVRPAPQAIEMAEIHAKIEREKRILVDPWGYPEKKVVMSRPKHPI